MPNFYEETQTPRVDFARQIGRVNAAVTDRPTRQGRASYGAHNPAPMARPSAVDVRIQLQASPPAVCLPQIPNEAAYSPVISQ